MRYLMEDALAYIIDYRGKTPKKSNVGIETLSARSVRDGYIDYSQCYYISPDEYKRFMVRGFPHVGDVLLTTEAPLGVTARLDRDDVAIAQRLLTLRGKEGILDTGYLYYFLKSSIGQAKLKEKETRTTVTGIKQASFRKIEIDLPDIVTQKHIASILESMDHKIKINKQINKNLLRQARVLFRQWVTETSSTIFKLSDVADINPETYSPKDNWDFINYLDTSSITAGTINEIQYILPSEEKLPSRARRILRKDDVVFSTVRPNQLHYGIISNPKPNMLGSTGFTVIRSKYGAIPNEIIYLALTEPSFVEQMQQLAEQSVSTFPSIRPADLDACVLPKPKAEDNDFVTAIKVIFNKVAANGEENQRLGELRETLLPKLMSGELDVSNLDL